MSEDSNGNRMDMIIIAIIIIFEIFFSFILQLSLPQIVIFLCLNLIYFLPFYIASFRNHENSVAIFILNSFLGWTLLGWVASLVWASLRYKKS